MDAEENPSAPSSSSSSSSRARNRRPSPTISSTTSPAFPTPHQQPGHRRLAPSSLQISLNSSNNISHNNRDVDDDNACQPSSSTATFTPPSPRARLGNSAAANARSASPMGSPDSTFWAPSPIASNFRASHAPISNNHSAGSSNNNTSAHNNGPATPGGTCEVSSSTINDVPPSPIQFHSSSSSSDELNGVTNSSSSNNNNNNSSSSSNNNVMLLPLRTSSSNSSSVPSTSRGSLLNSLNNHAVNSAASTSSTRSDSALKFSFSRSKIKKASSFERFSQQAANNINNITNNSNNNSSSSSSNSNNNDIAGASTEALNGSSSTATTQGLNIPGLNNNNSSIVGASTSNNNDRSQGNLTDGGAVAGTSSSASATSVLQATLSSGSLTSNSSTSNSSSSTSHSSVMLWDAIFKSSGANALRQIFSNSGPSSDKSLHTKIPSKKLAAKIASVFEQEEQQQLQLQQQQQQNELMNSLINQPTTGSHENLSNHAHHQGTNNTANSNSLNANSSNSLNNNSSLSANNNNSSLNSNNSSLNLPTNPHMDDPVASMELDDVNLMRELSESPLNLTETSANTSSLGLKSSRGSGGTYAHTSSAAPPSVPKKIPLTPKQKLLHRMQSGELLSLSPPPLQQQQQQQPPPIIPSSLNFQQAVSQQQQQPHANSLLVENLQQPPQHQLDPYYENLLQNRDDFMPDNLASLNSKAMEGDPNGVSVLYDPDAYSYYYGNMLGDEIFSTTTTTSSTTAAAAGRPVLMLPQGSGGLQDTVESLQSQTTHRHVEFILGIEDAATGPADLQQQQQQQQQQHDRGRDENMPLDPTGQFLDAENLNKNPATDSTLRNLLMMGPMQHDDTAWISADYGTSSSRSRQGVSSHGGNINLSGSMSMSLNNSWILGNDWTRGSWGNGMASSMPPDVQDEVMDMSVMDSPEKQKLRQGHLVDHQDIDDVDLEGSGLPLLGSMPMDLQQPFSGVQGSAGLAGMPSGLTSKNGVLVHDTSGTMEGNPINLQQHQHRSQVMREDEEPVNLMSVNLENELAHGSHHGHHSALSTPTEEMDHMHSNNTVLQHSSSVLSSSSTISRHMSHLDRTIVDAKQVHCSSGGYITFHAAAAPSSSSSSCAPNDYQNSISDQLSVMASSENDHIDERRIIRVKKIKEGQLSPPETSPSLSKLSNNTPSIILDKPVQPKSIASLPCPLNLHPVNGKGYAVFTARYKTIAVNTRFGPVEGPLKRAYKEDITSPLSTYPLLVMSDNLNTLWQLDRTDDELCNWMKFVRAAQTPSEQNAVIIEDRGLLYFSTTKEIPPKTELLVGYSLEYAHKYSISISNGPSAPEQSETSTQVTLPAEASIPEEPHQPVIVKDSLQNQLVVERENSVSSFSELFTCFECREEFPSVSALNFHLEHSHRQQEAVIVRRPKKKNNLKKSKFLENSDPHETNEDFSIKYEEEEHHRVEHKRSKYDCNSCGVSFDTILALTNHAAEHYNEKVSQSIPEETSKEAEPSDLGMNALKEALTKPLVQPLVEKKEVATSSVLVVPSKVKCTMCYKSFATKDRLDKHMIVHSDEDTKPLQCEFCPKRFLTNSALAGHIKTHAEEGKCFECPMCVFVTQQLLQLKEHVQAHRNKESGMFHCPKCTKRFTMYSMVRKHIRAFHGPRQFACDQCAMCFPTSDKLKLHKLKHSDHREFLCAECGRQFKRKDKLREHTKRMHENKKKVVDSHSSATSSSKNRPSKKLVPKTPMEEFEKFVYKCSDCMMGFKRRGMLVNHLAKRHPDKPPEKVPELNLPILRPTRNYFCPYCDRVYKSSSKRKSHILKSHPGKALPPQLKGRMDSEQMMIKNVATTPSEIKELTPAQQQQYREVSVVGKVIATPHSCQWCHRQYATRAKLLQHQRKAHLHLMPPDMQYPRTQKNNVNRLADGSLATLSDAHINNDAESINSSGQVLNVPVVQIIKSDAFDQPSSSTVTVSLAPDSSTSTATQIASIGSSTTPTMSAVSTTGGPAGTTAITLNDQQLQQLQIHSVGGNGEETGNVIGFLLTTATVNGDIGTLVPSEFVVVPISQQQQQQQQQQHSGQQEQQDNVPNQQQQNYPVLSAATMNAIHQTILNASGSSSSSNNNSATPGATLVPMTSNSNNILSNVISTAVSGISTTTTVNPIISPAE